MKCDLIEFDFIEDFRCSREREKERKREREREREKKKKKEGKKKVRQCGPWTFSWN